jgi:hypothetical protein
MDNSPFAVWNGEGKRYWGTTMGDYRAFYVGSDGNFLKSVYLDCMSDDAAIAEARQLAERHDIELWNGPRMVATLDHKSE